MSLCELHTLVATVPFVLTAACGGAVGDGASDGSASAEEEPSGSMTPSEILDGGDVVSDGTLCTIQASDYDQSCSVDSDCVISAGNFAVNFHISNYCSIDQPVCFSCPLDIINQNSASKYIADISRTPLGSGAIQSPVCSCPFPAPPCCRGGTCTRNCAAPNDSGSPWDAASLDGSTLCSLLSGPVDAGLEDAGPSRWCAPGQQCLMFNGGWTCCLHFPAFAGWMCSP